jgi:glyoxylase-like metal-dependent hydrolase (beta-lactamase superfamily II)
MSDELITDLGDGIWSVGTDYPQVANCALWVYVVQGTSVVMIDCGIASTYDSTLQLGLEHLGIMPRDLSLLFVTHGHPDHAGGARRIKEATGAELAAPFEEAAWIEDFERQWREYWLALADGYPIADDYHLMASLSGRPVRVDRLLRDGDSLSAGGRDLRVVQTRGHTPGHCALLDEKTGALFSGDAVQGAGTRSSDGATVFAPQYGDVGDYLSGLRRLRALPFEILCPAHHPPLPRSAGLDLIDASLEFAEVTAPAKLRQLIHEADGQPLGVAQVAAAFGEIVGAWPPLTHQTVATASAHLRQLTQRHEGMMAFLSGSRNAPRAPR